MRPLPDRQFLLARPPLGCAALALRTWRYWLWLLGAEFYARFFESVVPWHDGHNLRRLQALLANRSVIELIPLAPLGAVPGSAMLRWRAPARVKRPSGGTRRYGVPACGLSRQRDQRTSGQSRYMRIDNVVLPTDMGLYDFLIAGRPATLSA